MRAAFQVHMLNAEGIAKAKSIADLFNDFASNLEGLCGPGGREMAIVNTKLEEASFFAKKAMANQTVNQA